MPRPPQELHKTYENDERICVIIVVVDDDHEIVIAAALVLCDLTTTEMSFSPGWELALLLVSQPGLAIRD